MAQNPSAAAPQRPAAQPKQQKNKTPKGQNNQPQQQQNHSGPSYLSAPLPYSFSSHVLIDIGANLTASHYEGFYHGSKRHENDLETVLQRARECGVEKIFVTAGTLSEARKAEKLCLSHPGLFYTVGVHPTRAKEFEGKTPDHADVYTEGLLSLARAGQKSGRCVAIGECGLDYDREEFCPRDIQLKHFERHFKLSETLGLPLFLHDRNTGNEFLDILKRNRHRFNLGVIHSFTGSKDLAAAYVELNLHIGINGCSLKTEENLDVVRSIPLNRILLETDAPWCGISSAHASNSLVATRFVEAKRPDRYEQGKLMKRRNEPCTMIQVAEVVAALKEISVPKLIEIVELNTLEVFFPQLWKEKIEKNNQQEKEEKKSE